MTNYIVTGASGFIGTNLVRELAKEKDHFVYAVVRNERSDIDAIGSLENVKVLCCELENLPELDNLLKGKPIRSFFHLAWEGSTGPARSDYALQMKNAVYTVKAFELAEQLGCRKFLCAGTISERLLDQLEGLDMVSQNLIYALAKKTACDLLKIRSKQSPLKLVWMQFSNIYGAGNRSGNLISYTFQELKAGRTPQYGSGKQPYNFTYIDDLIQAVCCLEAAELSKTQYFLGSGEVMPLKDYLLQIPQALSLDAAMGIGARADDGLVFDKEWFDIADLKKDTAFQATYSFAAGIRASFAADGIR